jgi:hypothetical protein
MLTVLPIFCFWLRHVCRVQLKRDGTRWRTGEEVKGKLANGVGNQYPVPFTLPRNMVYPTLLPLMHTPRLPVVDWTEAPADLNGLVHFTERRNLVSARVPSHFKRSLTLINSTKLWGFLFMQLRRNLYLFSPDRPKINSVYWTLHPLFVSPCGCSILVLYVVFCSVTCKIWAATSNEVTDRGPPVTQ